MTDNSPQDVPPQPEPEGGNSAKRGLSTGTLVLIAVLAGAAVSAGTLYVTGGFDGNALVASASDSAAACGSAETASRAETIRPLLTGDIAAMAVRDPATDISDVAFNNGEGDPITLADTGDTVRLVNLWATWCAPCREEMPWLDQLQADRGGEDFAVVAVSVDGGGVDKPRGFFEEIGIEHLAFYHDPTIELFNRLRRDGLAFGLPVTLLVDEAGCVIANMNGPAHWSSPDAYALIDAAVGG